MIDLNCIVLFLCMDGIVEKIDIFVVGVGQVGVVMSEYLSWFGVLYLVLECNCIVEVWCSGCWDLLVVNGLVWYDCFLGMEFDIDFDGFFGKDQVVVYFEVYVKKFDVLICIGVEVRKVVCNVGCFGFIVDIFVGIIEVNCVVVVIGLFQCLVILLIVLCDECIWQIYLVYYYNLQQLFEGVVLVVGVGLLGVQIVDEL